MWRASTSSLGRTLMRYAAWGALWGLVLGFGLVAPGLLLSHRLRPRTIVEWVFLDGALSLLFAGGAALIAVPCVLLVSDLLAWSGRRFRDVAWTVGLAAGPIVVVAYALLAWLIGRYYVFEVTNPSQRPLATRAEIAVFLAVVVGLRIAYVVIVSRKVRPPVALLTAALAIAGGIQIASLPQAVPVPPPTVPATPLSSINGRDPNHAPLLFVGIDGGSWKTLDPLIAANRLPTLETLLSKGTKGEMVARWPPYWSSAAWGAILTGYDRHESGMYEDLSIEARGLPLFQAPLMMDTGYYPMLGVRRFLVETGLIRLRVPPRQALATPPFWEVLALSGHQTAVIRLHYSYPADQQGGALVISDWVGNDWQSLGVSTEGKGPLAAPPNEARDLLKSYNPSPDLDRDLDAALFPSGRPSLSSASGRAALEEIRRGFALDQQTFAAARYVVKAHPGYNVGLYLGGWDTANHALWHNRVSEKRSDPQRQGDAAALGGVLDRYLIFVDRGLKQLLGTFTSAPNVVMVSDHGFADGWHDKHAMFLASGPDVPFNDRVQTVSYFDVVPTLFDLQGLAQPAALSGKSILIK